MELTEREAYVLRIILAQTNVAVGFVRQLDRESWIAYQTLVQKVFDKEDIDAKQKSTQN